jgi:hypothetical protein
MPALTCREPASSALQRKRTSRRFPCAMNCGLSVAVCWKMIVSL